MHVHPPLKGLTDAVVQKMPYVTRDIEDLKRWEKETAVQAGETITVTEEDENDAVTSVRWRSKVASGIGRIKSSLSKQTSAQGRPSYEGAIRNQSVRPAPTRSLSRPSPDIRPVSRGRQIAVIEEAPLIDLGPPLLRKSYDAEGGIPRRSHVIIQVQHLLEVFRRQAL